MEPTTETPKVRCALCGAWTVPGETSYWSDSKMLLAADNKTPHDLHEACLDTYLLCKDEVLWRARMLMKSSGGYSGPTAHEIGRAVRGI